MDRDQQRRENVQRTVYFRKRDGRGTATYGRGYKSDTDATNARDECFLTTPDASMVWIVKEGCSSALGAILTRDPKNPAEPLAEFIALRNVADAARRMRDADKALDITESGRAERDLDVALEALAKVKG